MVGRPPPCSSIPLEGRHQRGVYGKLGSVKEGQPVHDNLQPPCVCWIPSLNVKVSHHDVCRNTSSSFSANLRCGPLQCKSLCSEDPRLRARCSMVATAVEETATSACAGGDASSRPQAATSKSATRTFRLWKSRLPEHQRPTEMHFSDGGLGLCCHPWSALHNVLRHQKTKERDRFATLLLFGLWGENKPSWWHPSFSVFVFSFSSSYLFFFFFNLCPKTPLPRTPNPKPNPPAQCAGSHSRGSHHQSPSPPSPLPHPQDGAPFDPPKNVGFQTSLGPW